MRWVYYYLVLLGLLISCTLYGITHPTVHVEVLKSVLTAVPILSALAQALSKASLPFYLFTQKIWLKFNAATPTVWNFGMQFSKPLADDPLNQMLVVFQTRLSSWNPKLIYKSEREFRVIVDRTIHLRVTVDAGTYSEDGQDHFLVQSDPLEVTYGQAKDKIERTIHPILRSIMREMDVSDSATFLNVDFPKRNPFFAFFVAHISDKHVSSFNLVFRPASLSRGKADKVTVTKESMRLNASTPEDFSRLSTDFLLLTVKASDYARSS